MPRYADMLRYYSNNITTEYCQCTTIYTTASTYMGQGITISTARLHCVHQKKYAGRNNNEYNNGNLAGLLPSVRNRGSNNLSGQSGA